MKKHFSKIIIVALIIALIACLLPTFIKRVTVELENNNVVVSLYYNDIANRLRGEKLEDAIKEFKKIGVTTMSFSEENINSMVARGDITNIKYNTLRHKYDDESIELAKLIEKEVPDIIYDSQLIITKDKDTAEFLNEAIPHRFTRNVDYKKVVHTNENTGVVTTVFCLYDGTFPTSDVQLGYNEKLIAKYAKQGFDICLIMRFFDSSETKYIDNIERLVEKYDIKHISIRAATVGPAQETDAKEHYTKICKLIDDHDLSLVITENASQLANETPFGFKQIFNTNSDKVMRSYETYDASQVDSTRYMFRYHQYLNSTIDRNIRFITVSQIHLSYTSYEKCTEYTLKAVEEYINKIKDLGYSVNEEVPTLNYNLNLSIPNAIATAIMILMVYLIILELTNFNNKYLLFASISIAVVGAAIGYLMPSGYRWVFSTAWAVLSPCFAMTFVLSFIRSYKEKFNTIVLTILTSALLVGLMSIFGIVQSSLLSGINYYVNNEIFRGIKLSLFIPLVYAFILYVLLFIKVDFKKLYKKVLDFKITDIKISWLIVCAIILAAVYKVISIYIVRSGNVNSISAIESWMRNLITDIFESRPRTKEFLVGYPCLVLFVYYMKNTRIKLLQIAFFSGSAITAASIANSFCHVFTTVETIYGRVINGVIIGVVICIIVYIANIILIKIVSNLFNKYVRPIIKKYDKIYNIYQVIFGETSGQ